jgi:hypothetical protein
MFPKRLGVSAFRCSVVSTSRTTTLGLLAHAPARGLRWSVELESTPPSPNSPSFSSTRACCAVLCSCMRLPSRRVAAHKLASAEEIINEGEINRQLEETRELARDPLVIRDILAKAKQRALLQDIKVCVCGACRCVRACVRVCAEIGRRANMCARRVRWEASTCRA